MGSAFNLRNECLILKSIYERGLTIHESSVSLNPNFIKNASPRVRLNNFKGSELKNFLIDNGFKSYGKKAELIDDICSLFSDEVIENNFPGEFYELTDEGLEYLDKYYYLTCFSSDYLIPLDFYEENIGNSNALIKYVEEDIFKKDVKQDKIANAMPYLFCLINLYEFKNNQMKLLEWNIYSFIFKINLANDWVKGHVKYPLTNSNSINSLAMKLSFSDEMIRGLFHEIYCLNDFKKLFPEDECWNLFKEFTQLHKSGKKSDYLHDKFYSLANPKLIADTDYYMQLIEHYEKIEYPKGALSVCDMLLKNNPENVEILIKKASLFDDLEQLDNAFDCYIEALKFDSENEKILSEIAYCLFQLGRIEESDDYISKIFEINKDSEIGWFIKAVISFDSKKYDQALYYLDKAINVPQENKSSELSKDILYYKLSILYDLEYFEKVSEFADYLLKIFPEDEDIYFVKLDVLLNLEKYEDILEYVDESLKIFPKNENFILFKIYAFNALNMVEEAIEYVDKNWDILKINYDYSEIILTIFKSNVKFDEAINYLDELLKESPSNRALLTSRKRYEMMKKSPDLVDVVPFEGELDKSENQLNYNRLRNEEAKLMELASRLFDSNNFEGALEFYDKVLNINPNFPIRWLHKGVCLYNLELYEDAVNSFNQALYLDPEYLRAWFFKGGSLFNLKRYEESLSCFDICLELDSTYLSALESKIICFVNLDMVDEAVKCVDEILKVQPTDELLEYKKELLKKIK